MMRIGEGYDVHRLCTGGPLRVGLVDVPAEVEAVGHSDGDVLAHAICDALLGALGEGDIGRHFPPSEERWRGASSEIFLAEAVRLVNDRGGRVANVDSTVVLERPRLAPHVAEMRGRLAGVLGCPSQCISVKAKTAEGLGPVGEGLALEARVVVLLDLPH
jgi:2-C-methyl-D-erythritol 2,4-cyclodiphosphate synthase